MLLRTNNTASTNRIKLFSDFKYAFRNLYNDKYGYEPKETGSDKNSCIQFISNSKGRAIVDWGDGEVDEFEFVERTDNTFICAWRSLEVEYYKYPDVYGWNLGKKKSTNENIIPYENHHYKDNQDILRTINITFTNQIHTFNTYCIKMPQFPIIDMPELEKLSVQYTRYINEVPIERISRLKKCTELSFSNLGTTMMQFIPDSIFEMTNLTKLVWIKGINLTNIESSNIRNIKKLSKLTYLDIRANLLPAYLKEFNELPALKTLYIGNADLCASTTFDEVEQINQHLTVFDWLLESGDVMKNREDWGEEVSGKGLENLIHLRVPHSRNLSLNFPEYLKEMRNINLFNWAASLPEPRIDTFVDNLYQYITSWDQITMNKTAKDTKRNQFYGLSVRTHTASYPDWGHTPSGVYQAPAGFKKGVENGNPDNPMEKIYVLVNNYAQTWEIKPADGKGITALADSILPLEYNQIIDNNMIYSPEGIYQKNEIITLTEKELEEFNKQAEE